MSKNDENELSRLSDSSINEEIELTTGSRKLNKKTKARKSKKSIVNKVHPINTNSSRSPSPTKSAKPKKSKQKERKSKSHSRVAFKTKSKKHSNSRRPHSHSVGIFTFDDVDHIPTNRNLHFGHTMITNMEHKPNQIAPTTMDGAENVLTSSQKPEQAEAVRRNSKDVTNAEGNVNSNAVEVEVAEDEPIPVPYTMTEKIMIITVAGVLLMIILIIFMFLGIWYGFPHLRGK